MKLLIVTRLYSGLIPSVVTKEWRPQGMPAYFKLLETLDKEHHISTDAVLLDKNGHESISKIEKIKFAGLGIIFRVVPFRRIWFFPAFKRKVNNLLQFFYCLKLVLRNDYDLVYVDRINVVFGAFLTVFLGKKVVLRLLGCVDLVKSEENRPKNIVNYLMYKSFKAPFKYIIGSQDGSGIEYFLEHYTNKDTPNEVLLNGLDARPEGYTGLDLRRTYSIPKHSKVILFVGRIEGYKGADLFIESCKRLRERSTEFVAFVVGYGSFLEQLKRRVRMLKLEKHIVFVGAVDHSQTYDYYEQADIYVSLNLHGNLSNTVLEAINAGKCILALKKDPLGHRDEYTEKILSGNAVLIDRNSIVEQLPIILASLLNNSAEIERLSKNTEKLAGEILQSWEERIKYEVRLLKKIALEK